MSQNRIDVDSVDSKHKGLAGSLERLLRRFKTTMHIFMVLPLYFLACLIVGIAATPGAMMWRWAFLNSRGWSVPLKVMWLSACGAGAYILYGMSLILVVPLFNRILHTRLKAWRGAYYSLGAIPWYIHNGSTYIVRYTFLEFITPTPFNILFFKMMGMKIGRGTVINSSHISDPSLIEIGDKVTIGGSATLVGHYGQGGYLVLAPVKIGDRATIGLKATIMGGVQIGAGAKIMPHSVVLPKTIIPENETWGGVPARRIDADGEKSNLTEDLTRGA